MSAKKGLGTGLNALFGEAGREDGEEIKVVPISRVEPREAQPRTNFDEASLQELAESIAEYGLIQPITARKLDNGYYQIIAGERRWRAARIAGLREVPLRVIEADDRLATELALVENLQREDLNPVEEALGYRTLLEVYGLTQEEAAKRVGKSRPAVANALQAADARPGSAAVPGAGPALRRPRPRAGGHKARRGADRRRPDGDSQRHVRQTDGTAGREADARAEA